MPKCSECKMLVGNECSAYTKAKETLGRELAPPPLGACMIPIVENYLHSIAGGMRVLDIGCGSWNLIKSHCETVGAHYEGIDVQTEYSGKKTVATRIENLAELSYADEDFDLVIGNQTMEHWAENGCTLKWGLYQCFRVCKLQGKVVMNVPIHFHGTKQFLLGQMKTLQKLFAPFSGNVVFQEWGNPSTPIPEFYPHPKYWALRNKPAYVLDIQAIKDRDLPNGYSNFGASRGYLMRLLNYPFSYNIYRGLVKAKLF